MAPGDCSLAQAVTPRTTRRWQQTRAGQDQECFVTMLLSSVLGTPKTTDIRDRSVSRNLKVVPVPPGI